MRLLMLRKRQDFMRTKSGVSWGTKGFNLQAAWQKKPLSAAEARFGITVSNHCIRRMLTEQRAKKSQRHERRGPVSVKRNRARRRLRAALQQVAPRLAQKGVDYVVVGRPALETLSFEIILKDLEKSFQKVNRRLISTSD